MGIDATLNAIGIVVADMGKTLDFYRRLGVVVPDGADEAPHVEAELPGGMRLLFDTEETVRSFFPAWRAVSGGGRLGLAFAVADAVAVDAAHAELVGAGYSAELAPFDAPWGQRYAVMLDPDGNGVDLFAPLAS